MLAHQKTPYLPFVKLFAYILIICACALAACHQPDPTCKDGIYKLPEYGRVQKCPEQLEVDKNFIKHVDSLFASHKEAARYYANRGWEFFFRDHYDTAMRRFNQSWLLDSMNADVYWGFANILGKQEHYPESMEYFHKSLALNAENEKVWYCASLSLGQLYFQSKDNKYLDSAINYSRRSIALKPTADAYLQLAVCYYYYQISDSARKYLSLADTLAPNIVPPDVRHEIMKQ